MTIIYLEICEMLTSEELATKHPQDIRIEVASKEEAIEKYNNVYKLLFAGKQYNAQIHYHTPREEGICELELIENTEE